MCSPLEESITEHSLGCKEKNIKVASMGDYFSRVARNLTEAVPGLLLELMMAGMGARYMILLAIPSWS